MDLAQLILSPLSLSLMLLVLVLHWLYKYGLMPYMKFTRKVEELKGRYSIYQYPYKIYGLSYIKQFISDLRHHGDSFYIRKHDFSKVDVTVGTIRDHLVIKFVNENLIQEFYEKQKEGYYIKTNSGVNFKSLKQFLGDGLLLSQGEEWRYKRKIMSGIFNYEFVKNKFGMISEIINEVIIQSKGKINQSGNISIDINKLLQKCFGNVVIRCFFGNIDLGRIEGKQIFEFLYDLTNKIGSRNVRLSSFFFGAILMKYGVRQIDRDINKEISLFREHTKQLIFKIMESIKNNPSSDDEGLIAKLLRENKIVPQCSYDKKIKKGLYTNQDLINEMTTFFFAGTDTTASTISCLIHKLSERKDVEQKLRQQITQILQDDLKNVTLDSLKKMNYLRYTISEILRVGPPVPFLIMREALQDHTIGGIKIEKGTYVDFELISLHYKEEDFENPTEFVPQRWEKLENLPDLYKYFYPFSFGQRVCIGQQLALTESKIALITFLLNFKKGKETQPARFLYNITYGPEKAIMQFEAN